MESEIFLPNRPPSPNLDALTMKYLNPLGSQESSGDSSSSDAASQTSSESPAGDWSLGLPSSWPDPKAEDPWQWMDFDKIGGGGNGLASLSLSAQTAPAHNAFSQVMQEPMILNFDDAFLFQQQQAVIQQQPLFPPSASPADILGHPGVLPSLSPLNLPRANNIPRTSSLNFDSLAQIHQLSSLLQNSAQQQQSQPQQQMQYLMQTSPSPSVPTNDMANEGDDIAARARALAGVSAAISQPRPGTFRSDTLMPNSAQTFLNATHANLSTPSPPPSTASTSSAPSPTPPSDPNPPDVTIGSSGRPKTSHTTIERRYRTNLNARITALRHAVPALRILDREQFPDEVTDERGYVDGVKAARKASKASVLGKAAEYIHVLKRRELRLRKEGQGLRALISGLIGGPLLLKEWEKGWQERFGSEERDEADGESDMGDDDSEDEDEKPRKKAKIVAPKPPSQAPKEKKPPSQAANPIVPETGKRKRGRPRKVQSTGSDDALAPLPIAPQMTTFQAQAQPHLAPQSVDPATLFAQQHAHDHPSATYLLGVFLFFSFFKTSPDGTPSSTSVPAHHTHTGSVLSSLSSSSSKLSRTVGAATSTTVPLVGISWSTALHYLHTIMSIILILSLVIPFLPSPRSIYRRLGSKTGTIAQESEEKEGEDLMEERSRMVKALRVHGLLWEAVVASWKSTKAKLGFVPSTVSAERSESEGLEQEAWRRLAKIELMLAPTLPFADHLANTLAIWNHQPLSPTFMDLSTLALLARPFSASYANQLWSNAQAMVKKSTSSHRASYSLRLDFSQAVEMFEQAVGSGLALLEDEEFDKTPIEMVTDVLLLETIKALLGKMFIKTTETHLPSTDFDHMSLSVSTLQPALDGLCRDDPEMRELAEYVSVIGEESRGQVGTVLKLWEKLWKEQSDDEIYAELENDEFEESDDGSAGGQCQLIKEIRELIKALVLLRKVLFSSSHTTSDSSSTSTYSPCHSSTMTPTASTTCLTLSVTHPPSPSPTLACFSQLSPAASSTLKLRQALAASVFDEDEEIDEARDAVVDMLCNDRLRRPRFH